jgi:5-methylcytosine-specific restriction endonuclease McrA
MALKPCFRCGRLSEGSYCRAHHPRPNRGRRWMATRERVFALHGRRCHVCGDPAAEVDHVVPLSAGGSDRLSNLRPICGPCNRGPLS